MRGYVKKDFAPAPPLQLAALYQQMEHNIIRGHKSPTGRCECSECKRTRLLLVNAVGGRLTADTALDETVSRRGRRQGGAGFGPASKTRKRRIRTGRELRAAA